MANISHEFLRAALLSINFWH